MKRFSICSILIECLTIFVLLGISGQAQAAPDDEDSNWTLTHVTSDGMLDYSGKKLMIQNGKAYCLSDWGGLAILDYAKPSHPVKLSDIDDSLYITGDFNVSGDLGIFGGWVFMGLSFRAQLSLFDLSSPKAPRRIPLKDDPTTESLLQYDFLIKKVVISGPYAYLCQDDSSHVWSMIQKINISNPSNLYTENMIGLHGKIIDFAVNGKWAYALTASGLYTIDVNSTTSLELEAFLPLTSPKPIRMIVKGNLAYIAYENEGSDEIESVSLRIFDLTNPLAPKRISQVKTKGYVADLAYEGGLVALSYRLGHGILRYYDVSRPTNPQLIGEITSPESEYHNGNVEIFDGITYLSEVSVGWRKYRYTPSDVVKIDKINRKGCRADYLRPKNILYTDRTYTYRGPLPEPWLKEQSYIITRNDDKNSTGANFLSFTIDRPATVYVVYDERAEAPPRWMSSWEATDLRLINTDPRGPARRLYSRYFAAGRVTLGGNQDESAGPPKDICMYNVIVTSPRAALADQWKGYE